MRPALPTDLLLRLMNATPEQYAAVCRILGVKAETLKSENLKLEWGNQMDGEGEARSFRLAGSHWAVVFDGGEEFHIPDTLGARYLNYLLHHPGEVISAFNLEIAICPDKALARSRNSFEEKMDPKAARDCLRELTRLRNEREEASEDGNVAAVDDLDAQIDSLEKAMSGIGGASDSGERARCNVSKALAAVRKRLATGSKEQREFAQHIGDFVSAGYECVYRQPKDYAWD
jgi:hypothetical protein